MRRPKRPSAREVAITKIHAATKTAPRVWNPRYLAYAAAHGKTPEAMLDDDTERWPGGKMAGFTLWISWAWRTWDAEHGHDRNHVRSDQEHGEFTLWLLSTQGVAS